MGISNQKKGKVFASGAGGYKIIGQDMENGAGIPFDLSTRIHVASVSKTITAIAIAKLVELGKLNFSDKIVVFLPKFWEVNQLFHFREAYCFFSKARSQNCANKNGKSVRSLNIVPSLIKIKS
jgi:CubicO group peptidase (beta-lactamase class C family)